MPYSRSLSLLGLALLSTFALAGAALARPAVRPAAPSTVRVLRDSIDHYRTVTWTYERAARQAPTPTSYAERRSTDTSYLQWAADRWTARAYVARQAALARIGRRLSVALPKAPGLHSSLRARVVFSKTLTLRLRKIYPGTVSRSFVQAAAPSSTALLRLWQLRSATAALAVARHAAVRKAVAERRIPAFLERAFLCIHHFEGAWDANTGNGYYGGLQMDAAFERLYGSTYVQRWGSADNWPVWAQLDAAAKAYRSGRGFYPWPNTARACGLL